MAQTRTKGSFISPVTPAENCPSSSSQISIQQSIRQALTHAAEIPNRLDHRRTSSLFIMGGEKKKENGRESLKEGRIVRCRHVYCKKEKKKEKKQKRDRLGQNKRETDKVTK